MFFFGVFLNGIFKFFNCNIYEGYKEVIEIILIFGNISKSLFFKI